METNVSSAVILPAHVWHERERLHQQRADALTASWRERKQTHTPHPVEDFLFTYYPTRPAQLRKWHPGSGVALSSGGDRARWRWHQFDPQTDTVTLDPRAYLADRGDGARWARSILTKTLGRPGRYTCFGLHEWAMVYRTKDVRHSQVPLRLGAEGTNEVVEAHPLRCTHFDAFRFFTDEAVPRNERALSRETQIASEQPGCLHANMDTYKIALKLGPVVSGELLLDAFELARDIRELDMCASPYDLREWGYQPVPIETAAGKAEYVSRQRGFTERANDIRERILRHLDELGMN